MAVVIQDFPRFDDGAYVAEHSASVARPGAESRFPCLDAFRHFTGCVGAACTAPKCWTGRTLTSSPFDGQKEISKAPRRKNPCATCAHVVDVPGVDRRRGSSKYATLVGCDAGQWYGLVSIYNLLDRRVPLRESVELPCDSYVEATDLRPQVLAKKQADSARAARRREALRQAVSLPEAA
jgi:hypothetical protein